MRVLEEHHIINGRVLDDIDSRSSGPIDISGLTQAREEVLAYSGWIHASYQTDESYPGYLKDGLNNALENIKNSLSVDEGTLVIRSVKNRFCPSVLNKGIQQYSANDTELVIPTEKVTATQVLPFQELPGQFNPMVDLRVRSNNDPTVPYFDGPGTIVEREGLGRWYRFPLSDTVLTVLS